MKTTIRKSHIELRGVYLPATFLAEYQLEARKQYAIRVGGILDDDLSGTLTEASILGGLARMYREFDLQVGDQVDLAFQEGAICLAPPEMRRRTRFVELETKPPAAPEDTVFGRQKLRHIFIEPFRHASISTWTPRTETDVYLVFGALSENQLTDYRYCCGASKELLDDLGYRASSKPDSIVIDRVTKQYLVAEFKMQSSAFASNHARDEVDLLICWADDETNKQLLPPRVLALRPLIETALKDGDLEL